MGILLWQTAITSIKHHIVVTLDNYGIPLLSFGFGVVVVVMGLKLTNPQLFPSQSPHFPSTTVPSVGEILLMTIYILYKD